MKFRTAVEDTDEIAAGFYNRLDALTTAHKNRISASEPRRLEGSVNIEAALRPTHQNDNLWDYAIGYRVSSKIDEIYYVEFHPARVDEVEGVIKKLQWLEGWIFGKPIGDMQKKIFVWVKVGGNRIPGNSRYMREINDKGLRLVPRLELR